MKKIQHPFLTAALVVMTGVAVFLGGPWSFLRSSILCEHLGMGEGGPYCNPYYLPPFNGMFRPIGPDGRAMAGSRIEVAQGTSLTLEWDAQATGFDKCLAESTAKRDDWYGLKLIADRQTLPNQQVSQTYFLYCHYAPQDNWHKMPTPVQVFVKVVTCGDGKTESPETCDDGNTNGNDSCPANCGVPGNVQVANPRECKDTIDNDGDGGIDALSEVPGPPGGSTLPPQFEILPERTTVPILFNGTIPIGNKNPGERDYFANGEFKIQHFVQNNFCPSGSACFYQDGKSVGNDPESAKKICEYAGYSAVVSTLGDDFASCGDNSIALWRNSTWTTVSGCSFNNQMYGIVCGSPIPQSPPSVCNDGLDNDNDGKVDYPTDDGCASARDQSEVPHDPQCRTPETPLEALTQCTNGIDDDGDGLIDMLDPGCADIRDNNEGDKTSECQDGIDNDDDGAVDYPADFSCSSKQDLDEKYPKSQCQDGIDNDGDGRIDFTSLVSHNGATNPTTEGWTGIDPAPNYNGAVQNPDDLGQKAWALGRPSPGGTQRGYRRVLTAAEENSEQGAANVQPWRLSTFLRITQPSIDVRQGNGVVIARKVGNKNFTLVFGSTVDSDPVVAVPQATELTDENPRAGFHSITLEGAGSTYHLYELVFRPSSQTADLFIDGVKRIGGIVPTANSAGDDERSITWAQGSRNETQTHVAWLRFQSNAIGDTDCANRQDNDESNAQCTNLPMIRPLPGQFAPASRP